MIRPHVLDVVMSGHKAKIGESEESRQENSDVDGEDVSAVVFMVPAENVKSVDCG